VPIDQLKRGRVNLPKAREVIAYCRGRYCVYAVEAVTLLRKRGYRARRLEDGLPAWRSHRLRIVAKEE
jgi:ArsR family transcriptional regulator